MHINIHGISIDISVDDASLGAVASELLSYFETPASGVGDACQLRFTRIESLGDLPAIPADIEVVATQPRGTREDDPYQGWTVYRCGGEILVEFNDQARLTLSADRRRVDGFLVHPASPELDIRYNLIHFALVELLKYQETYSIHASALERNGKGILIPGYSGQGKTTTCIALLRSGYRCLADDHPLLRREAEGLRLLSFPEKTDVTEQTISFFPELRDSEGLLEPGLYKRSFDASRLYQHARVESAAPGIIVFPRVVPWRNSHVEPLTKSRALEQLLPQGFRVLDRDVARRHFELLVDLVRQSECYTLYSGEDLLDLAGLIDPLIDTPRTEPMAVSAR